jgi:hypothetical protein
VYQNDKKEVQMKTLLVAAILVLTQLLHAAPGEVRRLSTAEARSRVEQSATYRDIVRARDAGRDITTDARIMEKVTRMLDTSLQGVVSLTAGEKSNMAKLININARDVLTEVARLSSVARATNATAKEKQMAAKALKLIAKSAHTVRSLVRNSTEAQAQQRAVTGILEISEKISNMDFGNASTQFIQRYERALAEGKSISEAVRVASNGKFTERELRECQ